MTSGSPFLALAATLLLGPLLAPAAAQSTGAGQSTTQGAEQRPVKAPPGFREACDRYAWLCTRQAAGEAFTSDQLLELARDINRRVNRTLSHMSDPENYGRADHWALPQGGRGDCEDYVLEKYKLLLAAGVDSRDISIAVARHRGKNHAVLVLHHASGDLVLDSLTDSVQPWNETDYRYLAMQARGDQSAWKVVAHQPKDSVVLAQR